MSWETVNIIEVLALLCGVLSMAANGYAWRERSKDLHLLRESHQNGGKMIVAHSNVVAVANRFVGSAIIAVSGAILMTMAPENPALPLAPPTLVWGSGFC